MYTQHFIWAALKEAVVVVLYHITIIGFPSSNNN
jgi:hypothetical protein